MQENLNKRGIKHLLHFTKYSNFPSIMARGLLRRSELDTQDISYAFNDEMRLDRHPNSLSVSISFPNYRMFYSARQRYSDDTWVVLVLSTNVLIQKPCSYYSQNAATGCYNGVPRTELQGEASFDAMFADVGGVKRAALGIPTDFTTDPQAEILVFSDIEPQHIIGVATQNADQEREVRQAYPHFGDSGAMRYPILFRSRKDYKHWQ